jgi:hypothetical protein
MDDVEVRQLHGIAPCNSGALEAGRNGLRCYQLENGIEFDAAQGLRRPRARISNRSHVTSNRVSDAAIRILRIRDQRLASEIGRLRGKIQKIARQRLRDVSLTLGNVVPIFANRT